MRMPCAGCETMFPIVKRVLRTASCVVTPPSLEENVRKITRVSGPMVLAICSNTSYRGSMPWEIMIT